MRFKNDYLDFLSGYSEAFLGVLQIVSPQWSLFWYTAFIEVEISSQDLRDQRPNLGFSTLTKMSYTFLNIIYIDEFLFKWVVGFEEVLKRTPFTPSMTYRTFNCIRVLNTSIFYRFFPLSISSSTPNSVSKQWGLT